MIFLYKILKKKKASYKDITRKASERYRVRIDGTEWKETEVENKNSLIEPINGRGSVRNERIIALC